MSIGDKPVNAITTKEYKGIGELVTILHSGLTYREWLIGMIASNVGTIIRSTGFEEEMAEGIIRQADAIINQLDKEGKQ